MKNKIFGLSFILFLQVFVYLFTPHQVFAQDIGESSVWIDSIKTGPQETTISLTIEVPNKYLEDKSILEAASIYGIDSKVLAQKINQHYSNQFQVKELDEINDLEAIHWLKIEDIKQIAASLQNVAPAAPTQKETLVQFLKEEKVLSQREFLFWSAIVILSLYFISYFLTYRELLHHNIHKKTRNSLIFVSFLWYGLIILSYLIPQIYLRHMNLPFDIIYHNLWVWFIIIFLGSSHALWYLFHYRPLKKKLHHQSLKLSQDHQATTTKHPAPHTKKPSSKKIIKKTISKSNTSKSKLKKVTTKKSKTK